MKNREQEKNVANPLFDRMKLRFSFGDVTVAEKMLSLKKEIGEREKLPSAN